MYVYYHEQSDGKHEVSLCANTLALLRRGGVGVDGGDGTLDAVPHRQQRAPHARLGLNVVRYS